MAHKRRHSRRRHSKRGGGSYTSAATYAEHVNGGTNAQYDRVFSTSGQYGNVPGNTIIGAQGQNSHFAGAPSEQQLTLINDSGMKGGRRSRRKRGGLLGAVVNQAVVPFTILGMQQTYRRKKHGGRTKRRRHRR